MKELTSNLKKVRWHDREPMYTSVCKSVSFNNVVEKPAASLVIISWRYVELLATNITLLKLQRQDIPYEIIFVNNGKDDKEFAPILGDVDTYVSLHYNTGAYLARNIGAVFAKAPVIIFLEDDGLIGDGFVKSHISAFDKYSVISVRGICRPLTENPLNKLARHYYLGRKPFPAAANMEGNCSYLAEAFFRAGGWNDQINFGHGGPELAYRLTKMNPDQRMQIYSPRPTIYHDYAKNAEHLKSKKEKQEVSYDMLKSKYPDWEDFMVSWRKYRKKGYLIRRKKRGTILETASNGIDYLVLDVIKPVYKFIIRR